MKAIREKYCTLRLEEDLMLKLTKVARRSNVTRSSYIRQAIIEKLEKEREEALLGLD